MNRRSFLGQALAASVALRGRGAAGPERPPNVVLLIAGGWRGQTLPFAEDSELDAPHLVRLAAGGVRFERAYTCNPASGPAKAGLLTGSYPHMHGVIRDGDDLSAGAATLPLLLARRRYSAGRVSGDGPETVAGLASRACEFVREHQGEPFVLVVEWGAPAGQSRLMTREGGPYHGHWFSLRYNVPAAMAGPVQREWARYYERCSEVDAGLGQVLDALDDAGSAEDTIVVFTSDHGAMLGSQGLSGAGVAFEESVRVPLVVRYPRRVPAGGVEEMPVNAVDVTPTLLTLAGAEVPRIMQGDDLSAWLSGAGGERSESVYVQGQLGTADEWRMVVRGLDKVVVDRDLQITHLYNLGQDPYEMENLVGEKGQRRRRDEMQAILLNSMGRASDKILPSGLKLRD